MQLGNDNNQGLVRTLQSKTARKVFDYFQRQSLFVKTGISIFGGTALVGSAVIWASANHSNLSSVPVVAPAPSSAVFPYSVPKAVSDQPAPIQPAPSTSTATIDSHSSANSGKNESSVTVNGQNITVPSNGSIHKVISDGEGTVRVDIQNQSSTQNGTTSYTNVQTNSSTSGSTSTFTNQSVSN